MGSSVTAATTSTPGAPGPAPELLASLAERVRPQQLANEEYVPLAPELGAALGIDGLKRGGTVLLVGSAGLGMTSFGLSLLSRATREEMWCAVLGLPDLGLVAADELGVALDRLVLVADPRRRAGVVLAALIEGCEVVLVAFPLSLTRPELLRLVARARQRRIVLVVLADARAGTAGWPEVPDLTLSLCSATLMGIGSGGGRITGRHLVLEVLARRGGAPRRAELSLPLLLEVPVLEEPRPQGAARIEPDALRPAASQ